MLVKMCKLYIERNFKVVRDRMGVGLAFDGLGLVCMG